MVESVIISLPHGDHNQVCVVVTQSCLTLCDSIDCSPPGFSVHGIIQARILEDLPNPDIEPTFLALLYWQADSSPLAPPGKPHTLECVCVCVCMLSGFSHVRLSTTLWTVACQAPLSMGFSRPEYWSGLPCPPPEDLPDPGIKPVSPVTPALQVDSSTLSHRRSPCSCIIKYNYTKGQGGTQNAGPREELWAAI